MPHWECGISFRLFFQVLKSVSYHFCDIKFSVLVRGSSQKVGGNLFSCTRDQHKVLEGNLMPQPFSVWRMAKSLDSIKIKSENQGPWREFGACYRLLFPSGASSKSYTEVCNNPALLKSDHFVCCSRKLLGKEHRQEKLQGSKAGKVRTWVKSAAPNVSLTLGTQF